MTNPIWLKVIAEAYNAGSDHGHGDNFTIQRIYGGANNALYKIETDQETFACKLCVEDDRSRAAREFRVMRTLRAAGLNIAPEPILLDESKTILPYPAVIYRWVEGQPLQTPLTQEQLISFLNFYHQLHSLPPNLQSAKLPSAWFHWFDFDEYLIEIRELHESYTPWLVTRPQGIALCGRLARLIEHCERLIRHTSIDPGKEVISLRLARVDPNIANAIWVNGQNLRFVDWEYSGWGDPSLDIAELRWHAALQPLGQQALAWLRTNYKSPLRDSTFEARLHIWDGILATRWPYLILRFLWSLYNGPDRERLSQVEVSPTEIHQRLVYYLELGEHFFDA
jgi:aminoglycoside phosphotransferase (APT) family kinase protein